MGRIKLFEEYKKEIVLTDEYINDPSREADRIDLISVNWDKTEREFLESFGMFDIYDYTAIRNDETLFKTKNGYGVLTPDQLVEFTKNATLEDIFQWLKDEWGWEKEEEEE